MGSRAVVVAHVAGEDTFEMALSWDDHVVQAFSADRADDAFRISVLPGRPSGGDDVLDAERVYLALESLSLNSITLPDQVLGCYRHATSFNELTCCPHRGGMGGDIEVPEMAPIVAQDDADEKNPKCDRWNRKEI